jgi:hypothetical protein
LRLTHPSTRVQQLRNQHAYTRARIIASAPRQLEQANFARRSFREKQMALNLAQFASENKDLDLGSDHVENLVGALIVSRTLYNSAIVTMTSSRSLTGKISITG